MKKFNVIDLFCGCGGFPGRCGHTECIKGDFRGSRKHADPWQLLGRCDGYGHK